MNENSDLPQKLKSEVKPQAKEKNMEEAGDEKFSGPHVGSSDAFLQTENTSSPDADNISDEKLDELLDED